MRGSFFCALALLLCGCGGSTAAVPPLPLVRGAAPPALFVANVRSANIVRVDGSGNALFTLTGGVTPNGIFVDDADKLYVAGDQKNIAVYSTLTGAPLYAITDANIGGLHGLTVAPDGTIFTADVLLGQVLGFNAAARGESAPQYTIDVPGDVLGKIVAIASDGAANLYVLAAGGKNNLPPSVSRCSLAGSSYRCALTNIAPVADATGIAVSSANTVFVSGRSTVTPYVQTGPNVFVAGAATSANLCGTSAIAAGAAQLVAADECTAGAPSPSLSAYDLPNLAPAGLIGGSATQLDVSFTSTVAVQAHGSNPGTAYAANPRIDTVTGYCPQQCTALPSFQISTGYPGLDGVQALYFHGGLLYTSDSATPAISMYRAPSNTATGSVAPPSVARMIGPNTQLCGPAYVLTDLRGRIFVTDACDTANVVTVYAPVGATTGDYDPAPSLVIGGPPGACVATAMCNPQQMVIDAGGHLFVTDYGFAGNPYRAGSVQEYDGATGALLAKMVSADIHNPSGIAFTPAGDLAVLSNLAVNGTPEVAVFKQPAAQSNPSVPLRVTPVSVLAGSSTLIGNATHNTPFPQLVIDPSGTIYIDEFKDILVFAPGASGDAAPASDISGPALTGGTGLALGDQP